MITNVAEHLKYINWPVLCGAVSTDNCPHFTQQALVYDFEHKKINPFSFLDVFHRVLLRYCTTGLLLDVLQVIRTTCLTPGI
jgi:hypothetical protein